MLALEFLGWESPPLQRAGDWLADRFGADLDGVLVALPGARAGRRLGEHLARRLGPAWRGPRVLTAGVLSDHLLAVQGVPAGRMARTLAWARALRELSPADLATLTPGLRDPAKAGLSAWLSLAERVRGLFGELAAEGLDFEHAAEATRGASLFERMAESSRWRTLARVQTRMEALLADAGHVDPHLARRRAIEAGALVEPRAVVLVGVTDMNGLLRRTLEQLRAPVHALAFAPEERRDDFDALGCLRPDAIIERGLDLPLESWHVAGVPDDQAQRALDVIADFDGRFRAEQITVGIGDPDVVPFLKRRLAAQGVRARDAAGQPLACSLPARLLRASAAFLAGRRFTDYATLLRHPDLECVLRAEEGMEPAALLDEYQREHLPEAVGSEPTWLGRRAQAMARQHRALRACLGSLDADARRPIRRWAAPIRDLLVAVYGRDEVDRGESRGRELAECLAAIGEVLAELEALDGVLAAEAGPEEALDFVLRGLATRTVAPAPAQPGEPTIELFGWLELALDEAPALVVTGFQDGLVPETVTGDAFLPDGLRRKLGLMDNRRRLARDLFATELILHSRKRVAFVSGRWSRLGDPILPSRIVFHGPTSGLVERVEHLFRDERPGGHDGVQPEARPRQLPRAQVPLLEEIAVTSFRAYLEAPYRYYLERALRLEEVEDTARELSALHFGNLAHDVLEGLGRQPELKDSTDSAAIHAYLCERVRALGRERFGKRPLPAVSLQLAQLELRLKGFATQHAQRAALGWRVEHVEWSPADRGAVTRRVDGVPIRIRGRIDRIDVHPDGRWAIWDYKTGDRLRSPSHTHRDREGRWHDLQLPLYWLLASELGHERLPEMGLVAISKATDRPAFLSAQGWDRGVLEEALEVADDVVRDIRAGKLWDLDGWRPIGKTLPALCGVGLVGGGERDGADDPGGEA